MATAILTAIGGILSIVLVILNNTSKDKEAFDAENKRIADDIASGDLSRINAAVQRLRK